MAKPKLKREQINRYLSFVDPANTGLSLDDEEDESVIDERNAAQIQSGNGGINNLASTLRKSGDEYVTSELARGSATLPAQPSMQNATAPTTGAMLQRPPTNVLLGNEASRLQSLFGNADVSRIAKSVITDFDIGNRATPAQDTPSVTPNVAAGAPNVATRSTEQTPEEKLLAAIANTNPSPQSFYKRLLTGLARGASTVTADDSPGSAFGKVAGNVIARAIPAVDSANLYQENVARAKERYAVESAARNQSLNRRKVESDILNDQNKRAQDAADRAERKQQARLLDAARLRDDKRAEAKLRLDALKDLAEDSPQREALVQELREQYGINVDKSYGVTQAKAPKELTEGDVAKRAESEVMNEIGASIEKIARDSTNNKPHIIAAREAMQKVLNDPKASNVKKAQARESYEKLYASELKTNIDYTKSDVESRIRRREGELRGMSRTAGRSDISGREASLDTTKAKPTATTRQSRGAKVQASPAAKQTNFAAGRKVVIK